MKKFKIGKPKRNFRDNEQIFKYWEIIFIAVKKDGFLRNSNTFIGASSLYVWCGIRKECDFNFIGI
ncbi:hypothetical protein AGMMS49953_03050 [Endomicrobiia bacterium]|uniref:hypothetical protein n=1 Tax=Endomicrobium trichonymphae TaxID=1408204 RepID=UPI000BBB37C4|nr:hypothetical protein [Candidatus Endomicrobium trichonymphae]GHT23092.1 hypothetical protein AGMMS49953_03050 [Endomicrobiia bacterium]